MYRCATCTNAGPGHYCRTCSRRNRFGFPSPLDPASILRRVGIPTRTTFIVIWIPALVFLYSISRWLMPES